MNITSDFEGAAPVEDWIVLMERQDQMKKMPRPMLETHLALLGWYPVKAKRAALQRNNERLFIIITDKGRVTVGYSEFSKLEQVGVSWKDMTTRHLRLLAQQAARHP